MSACGRGLLRKSGAGIEPHLVGRPVSKNRHLYTAKRHYALCHWRDPSDSAQLPAVSRPRDTSSKASAGWCAPTQRILSARRE
jgi:hypothetical protein